jgi:hypothetical protein
LSLPHKPLDQVIGYHILPSKPRAYIHTHTHTHTHIHTYIIFNLNIHMIFCWYFFSVIEKPNSYGSIIKGTWIRVVALVALTPQEPCALAMHVPNHNKAQGRKHKPSLNKTHVDSFTFSHNVPLFHGGLGFRAFVSWWFRV